MEKVIECLECGMKFVATRDGRKYCSLKCYNKAQKEKPKAKKAKPKEPKEPKEPKIKTPSKPIVATKFKTFPSHTRACW